jgi:uncharacterized glyoxalase superfamily protein PhnB
LQLTDTKEEVDALLKQAKSAGATITDEPRERPWGIYSGYFKDLDGHLWLLFPFSSKDSITLFKYITCSYSQYIIDERA